VSIVVKKYVEPHVYRALRERLSPEAFSELNRFARFCESTNGDLRIKVPLTGKKLSIVELSCMFRDSKDLTIIKDSEIVVKSNELKFKIYSLGVITSVNVHGKPVRIDLKSRSLSVERCNGLALRLISEPNFYSLDVH